MTREELALLQAAFAGQIARRTPDMAAMAPWLAAGSGPQLARYGQALRQHHERSLQLVYPVLRKLAGDAWFRGMAHAYGDTYPSQEPDLARFGRHLQDFLKAWPHAASHRYFADVARLEWLLHTAHGAPDAAPLQAQAVQQAGAEQVGSWRLGLHPAATLFHSPWRVAAIWLAHGDGPCQPLPRHPAGATQALVYRSGWQPRVRELEAGELRALELLAEGCSLGAALAAVHHGSGDPAAAPALFTRWLADGVLVRLA